MTRHSSIACFETGGRTSRRVSELTAMEEGEFETELTGIEEDEFPGRRCGQGLRGEPRCFSSVMDKKKSYFV